MHTNMRSSGVFCSLFFIDSLAPLSTWNLSQFVCVACLLCLTNFSIMPLALSWVRHLVKIDVSKPLILIPKRKVHLFTAACRQVFPLLSGRSIKPMSITSFILALFLLLPSPHFVSRRWSIIDPLPNSAARKKGDFPENINFLSECKSCKYHHYLPSQGWHQASQIPWSLSACRTWRRDEERCNWAEGFWISYLLFVREIRSWQLTSWPLGCLLTSHGSRTCSRNRRPSIDWYLRLSRASVKV